MADRLEGILRGKVLVVGVGNRLRGDDGAGPLLIEYLKGRIEASLLDVGEEPLNYLGVIETAAPDTIVIFDAAEMGEEEGVVKRVDPRDLSSCTTVSTHSIPLFQILELMKMMTGADIIVFGVQPGSLGLGDKVSLRVESGVRMFADEIASALGKE
jgi:hydrogenase 3 maturation protease